MDEPGADPGQLRKSLAFIRRINRAMGYIRMILEQFDRFSVNWKPGQIIRIVDIGTGSADIPAAILKWADRRGFSIQIVGVDLHPRIAVEAAAAINDPRLQIVRCDALHLPFADGSFDYAITSMFLHHLSDEQAQTAMAEMARVSRRGVIVSDLLRKKHAYAFIWLATLFSCPMVRHDARVSVAQSFSREEILRLRDAAGLGFAEYCGHMSHRFMLAGEQGSRARRVLPQ